MKSVSDVVLLMDMDGTILPPSKIPSQQDLESIKRFVSAGGRFSVATGRALQSVAQYFDEIQVNFPAIMCNGALVYDINEKCGKMNVYLPTSTKDIIAKILKDNPNIGCEILTIDHVYVPQLNEAESTHISIAKVTPDYIPIEDTPPDKWYKALFADKQEKTDKLVEYVAQQNFEGVDFVRSSKHYYEILPKNISKGSCVDFIREHYCTESDVIICAGDYHNDIEMLKAADIAVCPANAVDAVKEICDIVLESSCEQNAVTELVDMILGGKINL